MMGMSATFRYYVCTDEVTLRYKHKGLRCYIREKLHKDPSNGDVFLFFSRDFRRVRLYYHYRNGEVLTDRILHDDSFVVPVFKDPNKHVYHISWESFVYLMEALRRLSKEEEIEEVDEEDDNDWLDETEDENENLSSLRVSDI